MVESVRRAAGAYGRQGGVARGGGGGRSFALPPSASPEGAAPAAAIGAASGLLALQAAAEDAARDKAAERRGRDILDELAALQRDMLAGGASPARLRRLAALAEGEGGADPALREIVAAISLRARVQAELAAR